MATHAIIREADRPRIDRGGGAATVQMTTAAAGARGLMNGFTDLPPGGGIPLHWHDVEEAVLVVAGDAVAVIDGVEHSAGPGDTVWVAAGVPHCFLNRSARPVRIFWTYASAAATRTLAETGETRPVAAEGA